MIAWINFATMIVGGILMTVTYLMSVRPAAMEQKIGERAYRLAGQYRILTTIFMFTLTANYILYHWYPLPFDPFPPVFPWPYWVSVLIAVLIAIPSLALMIRGELDAGAETMRPSKEHSLYGGIYEKIRHPQAAGELFLWWVIAFLVNSPFLVVFSFVWVPVWYGWCVAEEKDLLLRYGDDYARYRQRTGMFIPRRHHDGSSQAV
ncbi:MAG: isoprenylcysteine carboxylmethyltransferase family protein [Anaerolineales bacterium]